MPMIAGSSADGGDSWRCAPAASGRAAARACAVMTTTAAAPSLMPEALPAVTVPALSNAGRRPASASALVLLVDELVGVEDDRVALLLRDRERHDLVLELPPSCAAAAFCCEASASASCCFAADAVLLGDVLGRDRPCGTGCRRPTGRRRSSSRPASSRPCAGRRASRAARAAPGSCSPGRRR